MSLLTSASLILTPNAVKSGKVYSVIPSNGNGDLTFTRASTATRTNSSGLVVSSATGVPRLDYSLGSCPNLLLEPQRTNILLRSEEFDNASWSKTAVSVTANSTISPDGTQDADTLTLSSTPTPLGRSVNQSFTSSSLTNTFSVYIKYIDRQYVQLTWLGSYNSNNYANFDLINGVVTAGVYTSANILSVGNRWYRIDITTIGVATSGRAYVLVINNATDLRATSSTGTGSYYLWGAQLEAGAYATTYIPTTSATVTRVADSFTRNNIFTNGLITAAGGTWFVELRGNVALTRDVTTGGVFINTGGVSTTGNGFVFRNAGSASARMTIGKVEAGTLTNLYTTITDTVKAVIKWNGSTADVFVNGVKQVTATAFTTTAMQNLIGEGINRQHFINEMLLFPTPLTDSQCIALTQ